MGIILEKFQAGIVIYRHPSADAYEIEFQAKRNCRYCYGRGRLNFDNPRTGEQWVEMCGCIHK